MKFSLTEGEISNFSPSSKGINNLIESFIPFLPAPLHELKNDNSLNSEVLK